MNGKRMVSRAARLLGRWGGLLGLGLLASCMTAPAVSTPAQPPFTIAEYAARAPVEIAVVPPAASTTFRSEDSRRFRDHVYRQLILKGYTPLAPEYVDGKLERLLARRVDRSERLRVSALKDAVEAEAFLLLDVLSVTARPAGDQGSYRIEARATLLEGASGTVLFDHRLPVSFDVDFGADEKLSPPQVDDLLKRYSSRLLTALPARRS